MIQRTEKKWLWYTTFFAIAITTLPYVLAYIRAGQDWRFSGFLFGVEDGNSYIAKMLQGAYGAWVFKTPYTTMDQNGFVAFLPYLILGKFAAGKEIHEQLVGLFQVFRWCGIYCYIFGSYAFVSRFIEKVSLRRLGTVLCVAGGGLGWLSILSFGQAWQGRLPLEFYSPESFGFLSVFGLPHLAMARGLLLIGISRYILAEAEQLYRRYGFVMAAVYFIILGFMQPMTVLIGWMVICGYWLIQIIKQIQSVGCHFREVVADFIKKPGLVMAVSSPLVLYTIIAFQLDPFLNGWASQNKIFSPPFSDYLLAYGIAILIIGYLLWKFRRIIFERTPLLLGWVILLPILAYFPNNLQRRLPEGIWTAYTIFMIIALELSTGWKKKVMQIMITSSFLSAIFFFAGSVVSSAQPSTPLFRPISEYAVVQKASDVIHPGEVILAEYDLSNSIPAWVPVYVVIGHGPESIHQESNIASVNQIFFGKYSEADTQFFLHEQKVDFILLSPDIDFMKTSLYPMRKCLEPVFSKNGYEIFRYIDECQ